MIYKRHYVQFNDLVFDGLDMIEEEDTSVSFKVNDHEYTFKHGSYIPFKKDYMLAQAGEVAFTLYLKMKKLPCHVREFYPSFAVTQLSKPGKLWAVQNNTLIWAYAYMSEYVMVSDAKKNELKIDVTFGLPEGVWHKADQMRVFLHPYDKCEFMDCYHYKKIHPCHTECCHCATPVEDCNCCECWSVTEDMALCYQDDLSDFYSKCDVPWHIVYDCQSAERFFGGYNDKDYFGQKFCSDCGAMYGLLYSDTEIPTEGVKITIHGAVNDPEITINGNTNIIKGSYDGELTIYPDGSVYYSPECSDCQNLVDVSNWVIPNGMDYGWEVHAGNNSIKIEPNDTCNLVCAYIEVDALTI